MTAANAGKPTHRAPAGHAVGIAARPSTREAQAKPISPPRANVAVSKVVLDTLRCKISPP
jgi:hypothetical protein